MNFRGRILYYYCCTFRTCLQTNFELMLDVIKRMAASTRCCGHAKCFCFLLQCALSVSRAGFERSYKADTAETNYFECILCLWYSLRSCALVVCREVNFMLTLICFQVQIWYAGSLSGGSWIRLGLLPITRAHPCFREIRQVGYLQNAFRIVV